MGISREEEGLGRLDGKEEGELVEGRAGVGEWEAVMVVRESRSSEKQE
jgi:hypothetical protein